jgi:hypothetical protein
LQDDEAEEKKVEEHEEEVVLLMASEPKAVEEDADFDRKPLAYPKPFGPRPS